jgi:hypothetical protein
MASTEHGGFWHEVGSGLRRLFGEDWPGENRPFASLLDVLVRGGKLRNELKTVEADAPATSTYDTGAEEAELAQQELETARADLPDFERALVDAWSRSGGRSQELLYSSADPAQDRAADVLIRYLVTTDTATVRSKERAPEKYDYYIAVDWTTLFELSEHTRIPLRQALADEAHRELR